MDAILSKGSKLTIKAVTYYDRYEKVHVRIEVTDGDETITIGELPSHIAENANGYEIHGDEYAHEVFF
ncbi:hypothetical protein KIN20_035829 [Parelaphostrongylus tenuis]|uniref:Uncharacterized protein n=1 Tax=Parelaphostrongylus tenuis TaxID=148309 RepID=A0AAD5RBR4_PARTN|nr:hypothetical protein KIN20_035829 [Parelaphostrongylus tenuis]